MKLVAGNGATVMGKVKVSALRIYHDMVGSDLLWKFACWTFVLKRVRSALSTYRRHVSSEKEAFFPLSWQRLAW